MDRFNFRRLAVSLLVFALGALGGALLGYRAAGVAGEIAVGGLGLAAAFYLCLKFWASCDREAR